MVINNKAFKELINRRSKNCISIYIPTYRANSNQADRLRFKNALSQSLDLLVYKAGMEKKNAKKILRKGYHLLDDKEFWSHLSDGLAVFIDEHTFEYYHVPIHFNTHVFWAQHFYTRPLLPVFSNDQRFFLLALSQNELRFFEGKLGSITPVAIDDLVPKNLEAALRLDDPNTKLQIRSAGGASLYHGQSAGKDNKNYQLEHYFRLVDKGLYQMLHDERVPLILAAVDYLIPIYKSVSQYTHLVDEHISGNPEHESPIFLHEKAWNIIQNLQADEHERYEHDFQQKMVEGKASTLVYEIIPAAMNGRVETLFIDKDSYLWGNYDSQNQTIHIHPKVRSQSEDLMDLAARNVLMQGGTVYNMAATDLFIPEANVNAIYRY